MPGCAVFGCNNYSSKTKGTDVRYFGFPKDDNLAKRWVVACLRGDKFNIKNSTICSIHFDPSSFCIPLRHRLLNYTTKNSRNLKTDAVPTLYLPNKNVNSKVKLGCSFATSRLDHSLTLNNDLDETGQGTSKVCGRKLTCGTIDDKEIMPTYCVAFNCSSKGTKNCGLSFHQFPQDHNLRQQWIIALKRKGFSPSAQSKVCSKHFRETDFEVGGLKKMLKPNAVPTIFDFASHLQPKQIESRRIIKKIEQEYQQMPPVQDDFWTKQDSIIGSNTAGGHKEEIKAELLLNQEIKKETDEITDMEMEAPVNQNNINEEIKDVPLETVLIKTEPVDAEESELFEDVENLRCDSLQDPLTTGNQTVNEEENSEGKYTTRVHPVDGNSVQDMHETENGKSDPNENGLNINVYTGSTVVYRERPYKCEVCSKTYTGPKNLRAHMRIHVADKPFKCNICNKGFISSSDVGRHMMSHTGDKPFKCSECDRGFSRKSALKIHLLIHSGEKRISCNVCNKQFYTVGYLTIHMRMHTGEKPYKCTLCDKRYGRSSDIKIHMRTHTGERPYKCHICERAFNQPNELKVHMAIHTGERPYVCPHCKKTFSRTNDLKKHSRIHSGERPFVCNVCNKSFNTSSYLAAHVRIHSGKLTKPNRKRRSASKPVPPVSDSNGFVEVPDSKINSTVA